MSTSMHRGDYDEGYKDGVDETMHIFTEWLINNNIIRREMFGLGGFVAIDCNDGASVIEFKQPLDKLDAPKP